jgi:hypothetical protein
MGEPCGTHCEDKNVYKIVMGKPGEKHCNMKMSFLSSFFNEAVSIETTLHRRMDLGSNI